MNMMELLAWTYVAIPAEIPNLKEFMGGISDLLSEETYGLVSRLVFEKFLEKLTKKCQEKFLGNSWNNLWIAEGNFQRNTTGTQILREFLDFYF